MNRAIWWWALGCAFLGPGCRRAEPPAAPLAVASNAPFLSHAQPRLALVKLWLRSQELVAEVARTPVQLATGMMHRTNMAENEAMLFVFFEPHQASFYMKNTLIPLSCAYIDPEGTILEIHNLEPRNETPVPAASSNVQYVLETRQGWFERHQIATGVVVRTDQGTLGEMFFGRR